MTDHRGVPANPEAVRWSRCETCRGWLLKVSMLRNLRRAPNAPFPTGERRTEWHHRDRSFIGPIPGRHI